MLFSCNLVTTVYSSFNWSTLESEGFTNNWWCAAWSLVLVTEQNIYLWESSEFQKCFMEFQKNTLKFTIKRVNSERCTVDKNTHLPIWKSATNYIYIFKPLPIKRRFLIVHFTESNQKIFILKKILNETFGLCGKHSQYSRVWEYENIWANIFWAFLTGTDQV